MRPGVISSVTPNDTYLFTKQAQLDRFPWMILLGEVMQVIPRGLLCSAAYPGTQVTYGREMGLVKGLRGKGSIGCLSPAGSFALNLGR